MTPLFLYWKKYAPSYHFKIRLSPVLFNPWISEWYPRVFVMGFDMQMCHSLTLRWQRSAFRLQPELIARYETDIVRSCRRAPELCIHSRILVREPWERCCYAHVRCESINSRCRFLTVLQVVCMRYKYFDHQLSIGAMQISRNVTKEEPCQ